MFGKKKTDAKANAFEAAKEAARRATFLNVAARMPGGDPAKEDLATLFRVCRASALTAGAAIGKSQKDVDAEIAALCDADVARLKNAPEAELAAFVRESGAIAKAFISNLDDKAFNTAAKAIKTKR